MSRLALRSIIAYAVLLTLPAAVFAQQRLPTAMPCERAVEAAASRLVVDLKMVLGQKNALDLDEYAEIRSALDALEAHADGPKARACFLAYPDQKRRYKAWLESLVGDTLTEAQKRIDKTCARRTRLFMTSKTVQINYSMKNRDYARARRYADALREGINTHDIIVRCRATRAEVQALQTNYLPAVYDHSTLNYALGELSRHYGESHAVALKLQTAFTSSGRSLAIAPTELEHKSGMDAFRDGLKACVELAEAAQVLDAPDDTKLFPEGPSIIDARDFCENLYFTLPSLYAKVAQHNDNYRDIVKKRWERMHLKGYGMEKVYEEFGRPLVEGGRDRGPYLWTYRRQKGGCTQFRFSSAGKLLKEFEVDCPLIGRAN